MRLGFMLAIVAVILFALAPLTFAQGQPTAEQCKRNPKLPGCEAVRK